MWECSGIRSTWTFNPFTDIHNVWAYVTEMQTFCMLMFFIFGILCPSFALMQKTIAYTAMQQKRIAQHQRESEDMAAEKISQVEALHCDTAPHSFSDQVEFNNNTAAPTVLYGRHEYEDDDGPNEAVSCFGSRPCHGTGDSNTFTTLTWP